MNAIATEPERWQRVTRWLHAGIALGISAQLVLSLGMAAPDHAAHSSQAAQAMLEAHELVGLTTFALLALHWLWLILPRSDVSFAKLFPYSRVSWQQVRADLAHVRSQRRLPEAHQLGGLAGLIHGLGFLTATLMAVSGAALYWVMDFGAGVDSQSFHLIGTVHGLFGNLMWAYLLGHVAAALWHQSHQHGFIARMFRW